MKKSLKTAGKIALFLGAVSLVALKLRKNFKKELKNLETQETEVKKGFIDAGLSENMAEQLMEQPESPQDESITRAMFALARTSTDLKKYSLENEQLSTEAFEEGWEEVIHVKESDFCGKKYLDFILRIPDYTEKSYTQPKIGDYIKAFGEAAEWMWSKIVVFAEKPHNKLAGYVMIEYVNPDYNPEDKNSKEKIVEYVELDPEIYAAYAEEGLDGRRGRDGLTKFYEAWKKDGTSGLDKESVDKLQNFLNDWTGTVGTEHGKFIEMFLGYKISFKIAEKAKGDGIGIDCDRAAQCVKYLIDELEVRRAGSTSNDCVRYENVLYCTTDPKGNESMAWHYEMENGAITPKELVKSEEWG